MRILITGGTGFVGSGLSRRLVEDGHQVTILTRSAAGRTSDYERISFLEGDPTRKGLWQEEVAKHDGVINLAGASIFSRWTRTVKQSIRDSRILSTRHVVEALKSAGKGAFLFNTSAVGYYGFRGDEELDENADPGQDFLALLALDWEAEARRAEEYGVRVVITRFGIVLGRDGGALAQMVPLFQKRLGGRLGSGKQWFSWIHQQDLNEIFIFLLHHPEMAGPVNCTAPCPVRNEELAHTLGKVLNRPASMPVPAFMIKVVLGEFGTMLLHGQRVVPRRLLKQGFLFKFGELYPALQNLLAH
jgi:uncharacterized protein (TIGR01777 family)